MNFINPVYALASETPYIFFIIKRGKDLPPEPARASTKKEIARAEAIMKQYFELKKYKV